MNIPMQFKDYKWRNNPSAIDIKCIDDIKKISVPYGMYVLQNYGRYPIVVTGKGEFIGENAKSDFDKLKAVYNEGTKGTLIMSGIRPMTVIMNKLTMQSDDDVNSVKYSFEFTEIPTGVIGKCDIKKYITAVNGDNLWYISVKYDVPIEKLLELNPEIMHPWDVSAGDEVRIN